MTINNLVDFLLTKKVEQYMYGMSKKPMPILVRGLEMASGRDFGFSPNQIADIFCDKGLEDWFTGHMNSGPSRRLALATRIGQTSLYVAEILDILFEGKVSNCLIQSLTLPDDREVGWRIFNTELRQELEKIKITLRPSLFICF